MTFCAVINELQYRFRECLMPCHVLLLLSIKATSGSDRCDTLLSSSVAVGEVGNHVSSIRWSCDHLGTFCFHLVYLYGEKS